jgi:Phosphotransferase enzyme family
MPDVVSLSQGSTRSFADLVAAATSRVPAKPADSKSGATFERLVIDGENYLVKYLNHDWLAAGSQDTTARAVGLWESGVYREFADIVDSTVVSAARLGSEGSGYPSALLMRDVTDCLIPVDGAVDLATHAAFLTTMAAMHARCWNHPPVADLMPFWATYQFLSPGQARLELTENGDRSEVLRAVGPGWAALSELDPALMDVIAPLLDDPAPLVAALMETPRTFVHGDWKMGNLGQQTNGRVVLLDWDRPSAGPAAADLAWYLAVNSDRLPESKEDACERYRVALADTGVETARWWPRQISLALLGSFLQLGWSKTSQPDELAWWRQCVLAGERQLRAAA